MKPIKRKAFTLVELLVVVAVIGILFVVLLSKVDFATDKAKASGVQTDFRSFQFAFEAVAKENAGFNTFGWDEGDTNGDRIRNNVDAGDLPANGGNGNGVLDNGEIAIGRKVYTETWTGIYSLNNPKAGATDEEKISAVKALEAAVNKNLDPKLHITITPVDSDSDGLFDEYNVTMSNQARDPWKNQYHGHFITNASEKSTTNTSLNSTPDGKDRGAFVIYSDGANGKDGSVEDIIKGEVIVSVLQAHKEASSKAGKTDGNTDGMDDYSVAVVYTYENGYGEILSSSTGFSANQGAVSSALSGGFSVRLAVNDASMGNVAFTSVGHSGTSAKLWEGESVTMMASPAVGFKFSGWYDGEILVSSDPMFTCSVLSATTFTARFAPVQLGSATFDLGDGPVVLSWEELKDPANGNLYDYYDNRIGDSSIETAAFTGCSTLVSIELPDSLTSIGDRAFYNCRNLKSVTFGDSVTSIGNSSFCETGLPSLTIPDSVTSLGPYAIARNTSLNSVRLPSGLTEISAAMLSGCTSLSQISIPETVTSIGNSAFADCTGFTEIILPNSVTSIGTKIFNGCTNLQTISVPFIGQTDADTYEATALLGNFWGTDSRYTRFNNHYKNVPTSLKTVIITGTSELDAFSFWNCQNIETIILGDSITSIGQSALYCCYGLKSVQISKNLETIETRAFANTALTSIVLPNTVQRIDDYAFSYTYSLDDFRFGGTMDEWNAIQKGDKLNTAKALEIVCTDGVISLPAAAD